MNFRLFTGFIIGVAMVILLWWFFSGPGEDNPVVEAPITKPIEQEIKQEPGVEFVQTDQSDKSESISQKSIEEEVPLPPSQEMTTIKNEPKTTPQDEQLPDTQEPVLGKKFFFWKPFSLKSKADRFAKNITSRSGVNCGAEKLGPGEYQVYFIYTDETDRFAKTELIKNTGINF